MSILTSDPIRDTLDEIANEIKGSQNLDELLTALLGFEAACKNNASDTDSRFGPLDLENEMRARGVDMTSLPTFGGDEPANTSGVWSWSASHMLVGDCISEMKIAVRE